MNVECRPDDPVSDFIRAQLLVPSVTFADLRDLDSAALVHGMGRACL